MIALKAKKGQWVQIHKVVLNPEERAPQVPEDTKLVPLVMRVKGYLIDEEASVGDLVSIETVAGRKVVGKLIAIEPTYTHNFGKHVPVLAEIDREFSQLADSLNEGEEK